MDNMGEIFRDCINFIKLLEFVGFYQKMLKFNWIIFGRFYKNVDINWIIFGRFY